VVSVNGIAPMAICIQKPTHPKREKAWARLSFREGLKAFCNVRNIAGLSFLKRYNIQYIIE